MSEIVRRNLFIGRYSPFHLGHKYIIDNALNNDEYVAVAVRERPLTDSDPYTVEERIEMISNTYKKEIEDGRVVVFPICDISAVSIGRKVGYAVNRYDAPENIKGISATDIRSRMDKDDSSWKQFVPEGTAEFFEKKQGKVLWFTGPSGAGKSTIANLAKEKIEALGYPVKVLDGDELRQGISSNLGLSPEDRTEHNRRVAHLAKTLTDVGAIVIVALISPFEETRTAAKEIIGKDKFNLIYVKSSQEHRIERDPKGLYKKAMDGEIQGLTGLDGRYDNPAKTGEVYFQLDTDVNPAIQCAEKLVSFYL